MNSSWEMPRHLLTEEISFGMLAESLDRINQASHPVKKRVLAAAAVAITFDRHVTVEEAEIFRAMSESLDCPVPPVVAS